MAENSKIVDGKKLSKAFELAIAARITNHRSLGQRPPGLAVLLVGENPASKAYVGNKERYAARVGMQSFDVRLGESASFEDIKAVIHKFNNDPNVDGILVQLPLPKHIDSNAVIDLIDPSKDADGLHPYNQGLLAAGRAIVKSCTPLGCMKILDLILSGDSLDQPDFNPLLLKEASLAGKTACVIGRSILVGKPLAFLLLERNATVTVAHSKTPNIGDIVSKSDIVLAAVGSPKLVKNSWVKPGAIVIDVGINRTEAGTLVGDVDFENVYDKVSAITPVPGGVGPMTVAMLIYNTLLSYERRIAAAVS